MNVFPIGKKYENNTKDCNKAKKSEKRDYLVESSNQSKITQ